VEWLPRAWWPVWLYLWWSVLWIGAAPHTVNAAPYVMGVADEETRGSAFSAQQAAIALMAFAGAMSAGWLAGQLAGWLDVPADDPAPYRLALCLAPVAYLLAAVVIAGAREVFPARQPAVDAPGARRPWGFFVFFGVVVFLLTAAENGVRAMYNLYLDTDLLVAAGTIGATYGVAQLLGVLAALATPLLLNRWGTGYTLSATALVMAACIMPIAAIPTLVAAALGYAGVAMLANMNGPARRLFSQQEVAPAWQITTAAIGTMTLALGWAASAALSGYLIEAAGFSANFYLCAGLAALAALLLWVYVRRTRAGKATG
jgi:MFS family permease